MKKLPFRTGYLGVGMVIFLMLFTLYLALAFPFNFLQMKQTETTEIKAVIVIGLPGEESPSTEAYFVNESPPENLNIIGYSQLTEIGKRRMYSLGRFLRLKYYHLLLNGNPHLLYARATDTNVHLESAQTLISAMNPPKDYWTWFMDGFDLDLSNWQPIAVHTNEAKYDDLLASDRSNCHRLENDLNEWKNSSKYQQLLNDFRHDLQTLRTNTGLEFEDDLDMLLQIESSLRVRRAYPPDVLPEWLSASMVDRLNHIADVCAQSRYGIPDIQRLYVGRLLHELTTTINYKIREHKLALAQIQAVEEANKQNPLDENNGHEMMVEMQRPTKLNTNNPSNAIPSSSGASSQLQPKLQTSYSIEPSITTKTNFLSRLPNKLQDPNVFVYILEKQRFIALLNSLNIYTCQPQYGSALIIEVHFDPISMNYFIRLMTSSSDQPLINSEPLRVNPTACGDQAECEPQQFEQNLRHLILDRVTWQEACNNYNLLPSINVINQNSKKESDKNTYKLTDNTKPKPTPIPERQTSSPTLTTSIKPTSIDDKPTQSPPTTTTKTTDHEAPKTTSTTSSPTTKGTSTTATMATVGASTETGPAMEDETKKNITTGQAETMKVPNNDDSTPSKETNNNKTINEHDQTSNEIDDTRRNNGKVRIYDRRMIV